MQGHTAVHTLVVATLARRLGGTLATLALVLLAACETPHGGPPLGQQLPEMVGSTTRGGKGIPNGRSDSVLPYLRQTLPNSTDPKYGYTRESPIRTGPRSPAYLLVLNALRGPGGEALEYERVGSCCFTPSASSRSGEVLLDVYRVRIDGSNREFYLYMNIYDAGPPMIPAGLTQRK